MTEVKTQTHPTHVAMGWAILQRQWVGRGTGGGFTLIAPWSFHFVAPAPGFVEGHKQFCNYSCIIITFEGLKVPFAWVLFAWSNELNIDLRPWTVLSKILQCLWCNSDWLILCIFLRLRSYHRWENQLEVAKSIENLETQGFLCPSAFTESFRWSRRAIRDDTLNFQVFG